jgi:hypothetical protein
MAVAGTASGLSGPPRPSAFARPPSHAARAGAGSQHRPAPGGAAVPISRWRDRNRVAPGRGRGPGRDSPRLALRRPETRPARSGDASAGVRRTPGPDRGCLGCCHEHGRSRSRVPRLLSGARSVQIGTPPLLSRARSVQIDGASVAVRRTPGSRSERRRCCHEHGRSRSMLPRLLSGARPGPDRNAAVAVTSTVGPDRWCLGCCPANARPSAARRAQAPRIAQGDRRARAEHGAISPDRRAARSLCLRH